MIHVREPAAMSAAERLCEVAEILARGFSRLCAARAGVGQESPHASEVPPEESNCLDESAGHEPSCQAAVKTREKAEVA